MSWNLIINSKFRPFTYDEMVKPLVQYKEVYNKMEQDYSNLATQTEMWKDMANQTNSPEAYAMYKKYSDDLADATERFGNGMDITSRKALMGMKRRYAQEILPIAQADEAMKQANEFRMKAGPDAIFEVNQYNSLDNFLHGKKANNNYQSREALVKKTAAMTEAAMAEALKDPEFKRVMGDQFYLITQHKGGSYDDLVAALANNGKAMNRFMEIKNKVMKDAGIERYDMIGKQAIEDAVNTGLYAGLDKPVKTLQANADHITPVQQHTMNLQDEEFELSREKEEAYAKYYEAKATAEANKNENGSSGKTARIAIADHTSSLDLDTGEISDYDDDTPIENGVSVTLDEIEKKYPDGYEKLPPDVIENSDYYEFTLKTTSHWIGDDEHKLIIRPKKVVTTDKGGKNNVNDNPTVSSVNTSDIPEIDPNAH